MAKGLQDTLQEVLSNAVEEASKSLSLDGGGKSGKSRKSGNPLGGIRGIAAGAGAVALAPLAAKGVGKLARTIGADGLGDVVSAPGKAVGDAASKLGEGVGSSVGGKVSDKVEEAGGPSGILKDTVKNVLPGLGGDDDDQEGGKGSAPGVGKGRRMPIQQSIDVAVPIETVYNQWTQFELWPNFMHRVTRATHEDQCTVSFAAKIWAKTKEFTAQIETQRPDERIKWRVTDGITHTGVVTFHEIAPRLTRIELTLDVDPGGMLEKAARGMRHIKRAARGDLHRFKAFIEMQEHETGAWRGVIEDGEVVEEHDPSYDSEREYSDVEDIFGDSDEDSDEESEEDSDEESEQDSDEDSEQDSDEDSDQEPQQDEEEEEEEEEQKPRQRSSSGRSRGSRNGGSAQKSSSSAAQKSSSSARKPSGSARKSSSSARKSSGSAQKSSGSGQKRSGSGQKQSASAQKSSSSSRSRSSRRSSSNHSDGQGTRSARERR